MKLRGTYSVEHGWGGAVECRSTWRTVVACRRTNLTDGWKLLEQGPESQAASRFCSGGVSAVMGSSDLDAHSVGVPGDQGNRC